MIYILLERLDIKLQENWSLGVKKTSLLRKMGVLNSQTLQGNLGQAVQVTPQIKFNRKSLS